MKERTTADANDMKRSKGFEVEARNMTRVLRFACNERTADLTYFAALPYRVSLQIIKFLSL